MPRAAGWPHKGAIIVGALLSREDREEFTKTGKTPEGCEAYTSGVSYARDSVGGNVELLRSAERWEVTRKGLLGGLGG